MAKKNENPINGTKQIGKKQIESSARMKVLTKHVSEAIQSAHKEVGVDFSVMEVAFTMNEFTKSYALHGLKAEWE